MRLSPICIVLALITVHIAAHPTPIASSKPWPKDEVNEQVDSFGCSFVRLQGGLNKEALDAMEENVNELHRIFGTILSQFDRKTAIVNELLTTLERAPELSVDLAPVKKKIELLKSHVEKPTGAEKMQAPEGAEKVGGPGTVGSPGRKEKKKCAVQ